MWEQDVWGKSERRSSRANSGATLHPVQRGVLCQTSVSRVWLLVHLHIVIIVPTLSEATLFFDQTDSCVILRRVIYRRIFVS